MSATDQAAATETSACGAPEVVAYAAPPAPKKRHGWIVGLVAVVMFFLALISVVISGAVVANKGIDSLFAKNEPIEAARTDSVAVIFLSGTIQYDGTACSPEGLKQLLDQAEDDPHIKAIVLRIDSGGGTATAGEEMAQYVKECSLPIVVSSASINASAAYEISSQADYIFTAKSTSIGSIGTAMQVTDLSGLYEKLGINVENIVSAESKDSSYGNRSLTDEERAYYQRMVDQINDVFIETVAEGRDLSVQEVRELATGLAFTGIDAVGNGLADQLGTLEDAIAKAAELAGMDSYDIFELYLPVDEYEDLMLDLLGKAASSRSDAVALGKELAQ